MVLIFSEYPRPIPSFRAPVPAPDVEPTDAPLVSVCFNYDWLPYVLGALTQLTLQSTWSGFDAPPDALAMRRGATLIEQFALAYDNMACPAGDVPAPYWEDGAEADDEAPIATQQWYGYVSEGNFIEDAGVWLISNFLATAIHPQAAVLYATQQRRLRIAILQGGLGKTVSIYVEDALVTVRNILAGDEVVDIDVITGYVDDAVDIMVAIEELP